MTTIIGLLGPVGSGKSTVAKYLCDHYGAVCYTLAAPLKEIARRTMDFTEAQVYGTQADKQADDPRYGFSPRWFLQRLGTEGIRGVLGEDFWVEHLLAKVDRDRPELAVIDDVRFRSEVRVLIRRPETQIWKMPPVVSNAPASTHSSENEWMDAPYHAQVYPAVPGLPALFEEVERQMFRLSWLRG